MNLVISWYALLLRLYPSPHRSLLGPEMAAVFRERLSESGDSSFRERVRFIASESAAAVADVVTAWASRIRHAACHDERCGCLPDFRKMRPPWIEAKSYYRLFRVPR